MKKLPIGVENYTDIINDCYYVDKTMIINDILSVPATSVLLFTRPRRFGKSLTLSMINTFFNKNIADEKYFKETLIYNNNDAMSYLGNFDDYKDEKTKQAMLKSISRTSKKH